jgi:hypothetical protein
MAERLVACGACMRHVKCSEIACPFCGAAVSTAPQPSREPFARLAAAAAVAAGVTGLTGAGCGTPASPSAFDGGSGPPEDAGIVSTEDVSAVTFYGSPGVGNGITCRASAGCLPGQVCCGAINMTTSCRAGPCPTTGLGPLQLCGISAECLVAGDICGPLATGPALGIMVCNAPGGNDGGSSSSSSGGEDGGNAEGGPSSDGDTGGDTGISDAPTGS